MKLTNYINRLLVCSIAAVGFAAFPSPTLAQEKGAERLVKLQRLNTVSEVKKVQAGDTIVMSCPKCKDTWVKVVQPPGKGGRQETATVAQHQCPGCATKIETQGAGKQAITTIKHVCKQCGSKDAFCCVIKKGAAPTKGMEEHKERH